MNKINLAPIVVFSYNRVDHLEKTLAALSSNFLANESDLIIFSDGSKNEKDLREVIRVRDFLGKFKNTNIFKSVAIIEAKQNNGLAYSIIKGVTTVINKYKKIIVVEDDVVTSPYFLRYMNDGLYKYENFIEIGSIASIVPNIKIPTNYHHSVFVSMRPSSWSWATWLDRWETTDWQIKDYHIQKYNFFLRRRINSWGNDVAGRLDRYVAGYNSSWAVRFTVSRIKQKQFALHPIKSLAKSIGLDNSGTHCSKLDYNEFNIKELSDTIINVPSIPPNINKNIQKEYQKKYKRPIISEIGEYLLLAILGLKKNSATIRFFKKQSASIKRLNE